jgi:hypothetical protein
VDVLPVSSVPAAFDRDHLYSPSIRSVTEGVAYRPGDLFEPMPESPHEPKQWSEWWRTAAQVGTPDFLGLRVGDSITVQGAGETSPGEVLSTCRFGAVVRVPKPSGTDFTEQYVCRRNQFGYWYL